LKFDLSVASEKGRRPYQEDTKDTVLNREPEIFRLPLGPESFVLVASDGVFDPSHATSQSTVIADKIENGAGAQELVDAALAVPTNDNVTAILVEIHSEEVLPTVHNMNKLHSKSDTCPHCGANLVGPPIPEKDQEAFGFHKNFSRLIGIYDSDADRTVAWQCPDCGAQDPR